MTTHTSERQGLAIREQFEQWAGPQGLRLNVRDLAPRDSDRFGQYCADDTQLAFEAFRAAALSRGEGRAVAVLESMTLSYRDRKDEEPEGRDWWVFKRAQLDADGWEFTGENYDGNENFCRATLRTPAQDKAAIEALGAGGEGLGGYYEARHWIERYAAGVDDELQMDMVVKALSGGREEVYGDDIDPRTTPQPTAAQPVAWDDEAAWALVQRAEEAGAERDSDDNGTWWTLRIAQFNALAATNTHAQEQEQVAVTDAMVERAAAAMDAVRSWTSADDYKRQLARAALKAGIAQTGEKGRE